MADYNTGRKGKHQKPRYTPHISSASSASKNATLGTIAPSLPSLVFLHRMSDEAFIASFAFVWRPPILAAAKASG